MIGEILHMSPERRFSYDILFRKYIGVSFHFILTFTSRIMRLIQVFY